MSDSKALKMTWPNNANIPGEKDLRLVQYQTPEGARVGLVKGEDILNLWEMAVPKKKASIFETMEGLIWQDGPSFQMTKDLLGKTSPIVAQEPIRILAPLRNPSKIIGLAKNYIGYVKENKASVIPSKFSLYCKFSTCIIGPNEPIILPKLTQYVGFGISLVVVIGKKVRRVSRDEALDAVAGYTIGNDITALDIQLKDGQWTRSKSLDTFLPLGPALVTLDELYDPLNLEMRLWLNGKLVQKGSTAGMIYPVAEIISRLSEGITLLPGDLILTGTPFGANFPRTPFQSLKNGDYLDLEIEDLGRLINTLRMPQSQGFTY
jgi:2-keto-4-pentenoate hydratase/2-oxohepta-3-ene-1,7-dioic acid hydratase in catechol pathway